ncbi:MAG: allantoicase, partial [Pseudomonadota bacterium]|nr:allantoicase [Pseudomonadota bacterium]
ADSQFWPEILPLQPLSADAEHSFDASQLSGAGPVSVARFNIVPDGGISRLKLFGKAVSAG